MKFIVDMPLSPELAAWLVKKGHDATHALQAGLNRSSDEEILEYARNEKRIIITADLDFPRLLALVQTLELYSTVDFHVEDMIWCLQDYRASNFGKVNSYIQGYGIRFLERHHD